MSRLFGSIFQAAYVVEEIEPALAHWTGTLGVGPFYLFPTPLTFDWLEVDGLRSERRDIIAHAALAYSGDTQIELIVPGKDPSPYAAFLDSGRCGLHHLGTQARDYDAQMAACRAQGIRVVLEGELPLSRFAYLETDVLFPGTMIELIDIRPPMQALFAMIKAASQDWDGRDPVRTL